MDRRVAGRSPEHLHRSCGYLHSSSLEEPNGAVRCRCCSWSCRNPLPWGGRIRAA